MPHSLIEMHLSSSVDAFGNGQWPASLATGEATYRGTQKGRVIPRHMHTLRTQIR